MGAVSSIIAASFDTHISGNLIHSFIHSFIHLFIYLSILGIIVDSAFSNMKLLALELGTK
jgi:hypothetical protein